MSKYQTKTAKLYQAGYTLEEAILKGAEPNLFIELETELRGASIPVHLLYGFKYKKPYSCNYHLPKIAVQLLQQVIKTHNEEK